MPDTATPPKSIIRRILVIKHGAFGDMILATGPMRAIRQAHPDAHISLLTTAPYVKLGTQMGVFDAIITDRRPKGLRGLLQRIYMGTHLRKLRFDRVYDLQHNSRTVSYFHMMRYGRALEWSGHVRGCSHRHTNPNRDQLHTIERTAEQLHQAGIGTVPAFDLDWLAADVSAFGLPKSYVILVPAAAPRRPEKVWPVQHYATLAEWLQIQGYTPVVVGTHTDQPAAHLIQTQAPATIDLTGQTDFAQLASVGRDAKLAIGNDTGPMHLFAATGTPSIVLFSGASNPDQTAPRGRAVSILHAHKLHDLPVVAVQSAFQDMCTDLPST